MMCLLSFDYWFWIWGGKLMEALNWLKENMQDFSIEDIFNTEKDSDWIWVNKTIFSDLLYGLGYYLDNEEEEILEQLGEEEVYALLEETLKPRYIRVNQFLFSTWEKEFKPTKDINTIIFVKKEIYQRMSIYCQNTYGWFLKAIAIDTYYKINSEFESLKECYEELYCDNYRIIEDILSTDNYQYLSGYWQYVSKENMLHFIKNEKFMNSWTEQQAESFYQEIS